MASKTHGKRKSALPRTDTPRSRRELLAGAAGALGVVAAETLARAPAAQAGDDGDVVLGASNTETSPTTITNTSTFPGTALSAFGGGDGPGLYGKGGSDNTRLHRWPASRSGCPRQG